MIKDMKKLEGFSNPKMPQFKGKVKITLHNCKNGKNEVIEGENIVTNAVRDILANNCCGAVDYSKIFGADGIWKKFFGGVLLYEAAHSLDADNYYPLADSESHLFAHAGQTSIDPQHDDDLTRGNPVSAAFVQTENSIKQVWEWGSARGNVPDGRYIRALSLTHSDTGDVGLGNAGYAFQNFEPLEKISMASFDQVATPNKCLISDETLFGQYDDYHGFVFKIGSDGEYTENHCIFSTNEIMVYVKRFPFSKTGLFERWSVNNDFVRKFKITSNNITFYTNPAYYFDYENKLLYLFSNVTSAAFAYSKDHINYIVIDCENETSVSFSQSITI